MTDLNIILDNLLFDTCTSHRDCAEELGINRVGLTMYLNDRKKLPDSIVLSYIESHRNDWVYTPEKLQTAITRSELSRVQAAKWLGVDAPYLSRLVTDKIRPGKNIYQRISEFCIRRGVL